ncbi:MAG: prepilin-type N-terminal cleavage/methylation domain-containing protein [Pseudomonadota bacterium]
MKSSTGFTLIEMTLVLVLLAILAVGARAFFVSGDRFAQVIAQDQLIAGAQLAQQAALARNDGNSVSLTVTRTGDNFVFAVSHASDSRIRRVAAGGTTITWSATSLTGTCAGVTGSLPHSLAYDALGNTTKTRFCFNGNVSTAICVSGLGFAYEGDCET